MNPKLLLSLVRCSFAGLPGNTFEVIATVQCHYLAWERSGKTIAKRMTLNDEWQ